MASAITVVCPKCNNRMRASAEHIGRKGRCPACKNLVEIVAPAGDESLVTLRATDATQLTRDTDTRLSSTNVPAWIPGLIGAGITTILYLLVFMPLGNHYLGQLFTNRGPMQHCTTMVACWGLSLLAMKYIAVRKQMSYAELELELIPLEIGLQITASNVDQFLGHLGNLNRAARLSILGRRIHGALEHFKSRNSVPEVQQYLASQAELDASSVDSGYSLLRSFIWVIPLFGFIGTVTGISDAVTGLDKAVSPAAAAPAAAPDGKPATEPRAVAGAEGAAPQEASGLMAGLKLVTQGLATAFDTTFLGLVMAIILAFPMDALRKAEYGMLDRIEAFTNESLLRRMSDSQAAAGEEMPEVVRDALNAAFREHQRWLAQWQAQVAQLGQVIGTDFEDAASRVEEKLVHSEAARNENFERLAQLLENVFQTANQTSATFQQAQQHVQTNSREFLTAAGQIQQSLAENLRVFSQLSEQHNRLFQFYSDAGMGATIQGLADQVANLAEHLKQSGNGHGSQTWTAPAMEPPSTETPIMLQSEKPRRGLFGRFLGGRS